MKYWSIGWRVAQRVIEISCVEIPIENYRTIKYIEVSDGGGMIVTQRIIDIWNKVLEYRMTCSTTSHGSIRC